jgi:hypothetical protein
MKLLRGLSSRHEFGEPAMAMVADTLLVAAVIAGGLIFWIYVIS